MLRKITIALTAATLALTSACGSSSTSSSGGKSDANAVLKVGASPVPHAQILDYVEKNLAPKAGLKLKVVDFDDYVQPNMALNDGTIQANFFQHKPYMDDFAASKGLKLDFVSPIFIEPLGVYSKKIKKLSDLRDGAKIALPNDATNEARAFSLLADNGLVTLRPGVGIKATERDIASNPRHLKFTTLAAPQLPRSLPDVDAAVINGNFAQESGLSPAKDALVLEKAQGNPYANGVVTLAGKQNDPRVQKLVELLRSPEVKQFIESKYQGSVVPAF